MPEPRSIVILSSGRTIASTRRLEEVLTERGHSVAVLQPEDLQIVVDGEVPALLHRGRAVDLPDAVIPRIPTSKSVLGAAIVTQFEQMGVYCLNSTRALESSRNKLRALQKLSRHGIALPKTMFLSARGRGLDGVIEQIGGAPVIIKLVEGTQGVGVMLAETEEGALAILETLRKTGHDVLLQAFVAESRGRDVRMLVVGGKVLAAVRRVASGKEFRSNVHRGAQAEAYPIEPAYADTARRAAQILGLSVAGVDMLEGADGPVIMEVNSSPAIAGMEEATGLDLATPIAELIERRLHHPPLDVVQRLTMSPDHGVCEVHLNTASELVGQTLAETNLRELGLQVLQVRRGPELVSSPRGRFQLEADDILVMYGSLEAAKHLD